MKIVKGAAMKIDRHIGILSILLQKDTVTAPEKLRTVIRHPVKKEAVCPIKNSIYIHFPRGYNSIK